MTPASRVDARRRDAVAAVASLMAVLAALLGLALTSIPADAATEQPATESGEGGGDESGDTGGGDTDGGDVDAGEGGTGDTDTNDDALDGGGSDATVGEGTDLGVLSVVVLVGLVAVVVAVVSSSRREQPVPSEPPGPGARDRWRTRGRAAYVDARWLRDTFDDELARWYGARLAGRAPEDTDGQGRQWAQLERRLPVAADALYELEARATTAGDREVVTDVSSSLQATRAAFDALARRWRDRAAQGAMVNTNDDLAERQRDLEVARARLDRDLAVLASLTSESDEG